MKNLQFVFALSSVLMLAACNNTLQGLKSDAKDATKWAHNKPSSMERFFGTAPTGYTGNSKTPMLPETPQAAATTTTTTVNNEDGTVTVTQVKRTSTPVRTISSRGLTWEKIDNYDDWGSGYPQYTAPQPLQKDTARVIKYNDTVNVYPVDGDAEPYTQFRPSEQGLGYPVVTGQMVQQIFFSHGSSSVGKPDRRSLHQLADSMVHSANTYGLNVVGHASKRVDHVKDPVEKKMINFKMAQRRANAVTAELRSAGADPHWIMASSRGDEEPNLHRGSKTQEAADRRVEVFVNDQ
jgi:outer membrane protein OmpA-like peptidoglycan-associated protein